MKWSDNHDNDGQQAPVPYRLSPSHTKVKAGCWSTALLILLALALLGCKIADGVRRFAEPVDEGGCKWDCGREGLEFADYTYESDSCFCVNEDGVREKLYGLDLEGDQP